VFKNGWFSAQNALKLTYEHLYLKKFFSGSPSLAMRGGKIKKGEGRKGGKGKGKGKGGQGRGKNGRYGKEGGGERERTKGKGKGLGPPESTFWLRHCCMEVKVRMFP
jgi:hypothetical protein